jgi:hypothetical protein
MIDPRNRFLPRGQGFDATQMLAYERPYPDRSLLQLWTYTDRLSYAPGETVAIHAICSAGRFEIEIALDGRRPRTLERIAVEAPWQELRPGFQEDGCDWPVVHRWTVPRDLPSGFILLISRATAADGTVRQQEHGFAVRALEPGQRSRSVLVLATCTWQAYNDWGGGNHYMADAMGPLSFAPRLSIHRPYSKGFMVLPINAPRRVPDRTLPFGGITRHNNMEFALFRGLSKFYSSAGWASYDRHFSLWMEREGRPVDLITQHDLQSEPELLARYDTALFVGHDEYWTWEMRDAVERFARAGGRVGRFAGNFYWQIRLEAGNTRQVCYKWDAHVHDPVRTNRISCNWEDPAVGRPGAATFGLNGGYGIYAGVGGMVPRGPSGFTVYRPEHPMLAGSDLYYGDILGTTTRIFGYEVDGLDYVVRDGMAYPTETSGAPEGLEIIALGLATNTEADHAKPWESGFFNQFGDPALEVLPLRYGEDTPENRARASRGSGMVVDFRLGAGSVFHAGTCEWVAGLTAADPAVEQVTRNVLDQAAAR